MFDALVNDVNAESDFDHILLPKVSVVSLAAVFVAATISGFITGRAVCEVVLWTLKAVECSSEASVGFWFNVCPSLSEQRRLTVREDFFSVCLAAQECERNWFRRRLW